jgi:mono/diheme cytochrome c family protein
MRARALLLVMTIGVAIVAVACGRASESDINSALGITPSPTQSAEDMATSAAKAAADSATLTAAAASAGSPGAVALGDITQGEAQFNIFCAQCHKPDGSGRGPALVGADSPAAGLTDEQLTDLIRNGTNHDPPGAYKTTEISDKQITNINAYIHSITAPQ